MLSIIYKNVVLVILSLTLFCSQEIQDVYVFRVHELGDE